MLLLSLSFNFLFFGPVKVFLLIQDLVFESLLLWNSFLLERLVLNLNDEPLQSFNLCLVFFFQSWEPFFSSFFDPFDDFYWVNWFCFEFAEDFFCSAFKASVFARVGSAHCGPFFEQLDVFDGLSSPADSALSFRMDRKRFYWKNFWFVRLWGLRKIFNRVNFDIRRLVSWFGFWLNLILRIRLLILNFVCFVLGLQLFVVINQFHQILLHLSGVLELRFVAGARHRYQSCVAPKNIPNHFLFISFFNFVFAQNRLVDQRMCQYRLVWKLFFQNPLIGFFSLLVKNGFESFSLRKVGLVFLSRCFVFEPTVDDVIGK